MPTDISTPPAQIAAATADEADPELMALPDPPRGERRWTLVLLGVTALASIAMVIALRRDAAYAFATDDAADVGDLLHADGLATNRFVRGHGMLGAAGAIRYERAFEADSYRVSPVAGRADLYVETRVPSGEENARYVPKSAFSGRLVPFDAAGPRHRGLARAIEDATGTKVAPNAWLLVDGQKPADARWAVALVALFLLFAIWNVTTIARLVRPAR